MYIKIHQSHRTRAVVAIADAELVGKKFEEGKLQLDVRENFYKGDLKSKEEVVKIIQFQKREDSTFNIVGKKSVQAAIEADLITEDSVGTIANIPYTLTLL